MSRQQQVNRHIEMQSLRERERERDSGMVEAGSGKEAMWCSLRRRKRRHKTVWGEMLPGAAQPPASPRKSMMKQQRQQCARAVWVVAGARGSVAGQVQKWCARAAAARGQRK